MRADFFNVKYMPVPESGCWLWIACVRKTGYGAFGMGNRRTEYAHRASWLLFRGPIPSGMFVCHKCDTPSCVNPSHLFLGSCAENGQDAARKGRIRLPRASYASDETHQPAKLTNDQVREIRGSSTGLKALAARFGVTPRTIWAARTRQTFRDVA